MFLVASVCVCLMGLDRYRYRVSGIGRYSPVLMGIGIGRYLFEYRHRY